MKCLQVRQGYGYEGEVLYFLDSGLQTIGLLKKKTIWYFPDSFTSDYNTMVEMGRQPSSVHFRIAVLGFFLQVHSLSSHPRKSAPCMPAKRQMLQYVLDVGCTEQGMVIVVPGCTGGL